MITELQPPLSRYFEATNAHDAERVAALFADDALVHDEHVDHRGREAIRHWAESTYERYDLRVSPGDQKPAEGSTIVRARVAGRFLGSPLELNFRFVTDGEQINELRIG